MFRTFVALLSAAALVPASAQAGSEPAVLPAPPQPGSVVERSEHATTTMVDGGTFRTRTYAEAVNFKVNGRWRPIDHSLKATASGDVAPAAVNGDATIPDVLSKPIGLAHDGRRIGIRLLGVRGARRAVDGATASFAEAMDGVDVTYEARSSGLKETIILKQPDRPSVFRYAVTGGSDLTAKLEEGNVVFRDDDGSVRFAVSAPIAWDSSEPVSYSNGLELSVERTAPGRWTIAMSADERWLRDPARTYPISLDPTFEWRGDNAVKQRGADADCYLASLNQANSFFCGAPTLQVGYYNRSYKSIFRFGVDQQIPNDVEVLSATMNLYSPGPVTRPIAAMRVRAVKSSWDHLATWSKRNATTSWATPGGDVTTRPEYIGEPTSVKDGARDYAFQVPPALVQDWVDQSIPNYGIQLATDAGAPANTSYGFASSEATDVGTRPSLDVIWKPVMPEVVEEAVPAIARRWAIETGSADSIAPLSSDPTDPECDETCTALLTRHDPRPGLGPVQADKKFLPQAVEKAAQMEGKNGLVNSSLQQGAKRMLPRLVLIGVTGGLVGVAGTLYIAYTIYKDSTTPDAVPSPDPIWIRIPYVDVGAGICQWVRPDLATMPNYSPFPITYPPGLVAQRCNSTGAIMWQSSSHSECNEIPRGFPVGAQPYAWEWARCLGYTDEWKLANGLFLSYKWMFNTDPEGPGPDVEPYDEFQGTSPSITQAEAEALVRESLNSGGAKEANDLLCHALGGNCPDPRYETARIPDCTGVDFNACSARLVDAGFKGTITKEVLSTDDATNGLGANATVDTRPTTKVDLNVNEPIEVLVNPPTLVAYTPEVIAVADAMRARNVELRDAPQEFLSIERTRMLVRECKRLLVRRAATQFPTPAAPQASDCLEFKIFVPGGMDAYGPALNDRRAIDVFPYWTVLNRRERNVYTPVWYNEYPPCVPPRERGLQCDEYPYGVSNQGWNGKNTSIPRPRLALVKGVENQLEGNRLGHFYSGNGSGGDVLRWPGCNVSQTPGNPNADMPRLPPVENSEYLVIPMPFAKIRTFGICKS